MSKRLTQGAITLALGIALAILAVRLSGHPAIPGWSAGTLAGEWVQSSEGDFAAGSSQQVEAIPLGDGALRLLPTAVRGHFTSTISVAPFPFNALGVCWRAQVAPGTHLRVSSRTVAQDGFWSDWQAASEMDRVSQGRYCAAEPLPAAGGHAMQWHVSFEAESPGSSPVLNDVTLTYINSTSGPTAAQAHQAAFPLGEGVVQDVLRPYVIPRSGWGADESLRFDHAGTEIWPTEYHPVQKVIIHHTATENDAQDPAAWVRAIYYYHAVTKDWGDIGYNYLVDRTGNIYEGRYGGPDVEGGHAKPYNVGSVGIGAIGTYGNAAGSVWPASPLMQALNSLAAWECARSLIDPEGSSFFVETDLPNIAGHRECLIDGQSTTVCPGDYLFAELPALRHEVASRLEDAFARYDARFHDHNTPPLMAAGETYVVSLSVENAGTLTWPATGSSPVRLGYHWYDASGQQVIQPPEEDHRTPLEADVPFGGQAVLASARVTAPHDAGVYRLEWDLVHEGVTWFLAQGSTALSVDTTVSESPVLTDCVEAIVNGGFEYDSEDWETPSDRAEYSTAQAHSGQRSMRLGIVPPDPDQWTWSSTYQRITVPSNVSEATLSFWYKPYAEGTGDADYQLASLLDGPPPATQIEKIMVQHSNAGVWTKQQFDMLPYAGQTIYLYFTAYNDGNGARTWMYIDDVSLELCTAAAPSHQGDAFGLCFVSAADNLASEERYDGALAAGVRWDRWPLYWHWVDEGGYVGWHDGAFHDYDTLVTQEMAHGITPIAILLGTADQRATAGSLDVPPPQVQDKMFFVRDRAVVRDIREVSTATSPPVGLFEPIFADGTDIPAPGKAVNQGNPWAAFVHDTVGRYRPGGLLATEEAWPAGSGVRHWEIWNEPDLAQFWNGTVAEYYRLLEVGYQTIKAADAEATVLLGGLAFWDEPTWLSDLLALTDGDPEQAYFDVLSYHYYWSIYDGENWIMQSRATLAAHGLSGIPIWITESGVPVWGDFPAEDVPSDSPWRGSMEEQAAYVIQNAALALHHGVERSYHFMLHDDCGNDPAADAFGLRQNFTPHVCNPADGKRRPSYAAHQLAAEQFRGLVPLWRKHLADQDQIAFYRPEDRSRVLVLWATKGAPVVATVDATGEAAQRHWVELASSPQGTTGVSQTTTLVPTDGVYTLTLPQATNQNHHPDENPPDDLYYIGGRPYILVERDTLAPTSTLEPLPPVSEEGDIALQWQGEDAGSGIASYDVWVSQDGGALQPWITGTEAVTAVYPGLDGHTYGFALRARDRADNEEPVPSEPQAVTHVGTGLTITGPTRGEVNAPYTFTAAVHWPAATPPVTYTWQPTGLATIIETSGLTHTATLTWTTVGAKYITVTATCEEGTDTDSRVISVYTPSSIYLPFIMLNR